MFKRSVLKKIFYVNILITLRKKNCEFILETAAKKKEKMGLAQILAIEKKSTILMQSS